MLTPQVLALGPELNPAIDFIRNAQQQDGAIVSTNPLASEYQTTAKAVLELKAFSPLSDDIVNNAINYLTTYAINNEFRSRYLLVQIDGQIESDLLATQNSDGGFGANSNFASNPLDTAIGLSALREGNSKIGIIADNYSLVADGVQNFPIDVAVDATHLDILVTALTGTVEVRITQGAPPTIFDPYFLLSSGNILIRIGQGGALPLTPGLNYIQFSSPSTPSNFSFNANYYAASGDTTALTSAASYLLSSRNSDGGWGVQANDENSFLYTTYYATRALQGVVYPFDPSAYVLSKQINNSGFGDSGTANILDTSAALLTLTELGLDVSNQASALDYLAANQLADGSLESDPFQTAWGLAAANAASNLAFDGFNLFGNAAGGDLSLTLNGSVIGVVTTVGEPATDVLLALADEVNSSGLGVAASVNGNRLITSVIIENIQINDSGLRQTSIEEDSEEIPLLPPFAQLLLLLSMFFARKWANRTQSGYIIRRKNRNKSKAS